MTASPDYFVSKSAIDGAPSAVIRVIRRRRVEVVTSQNSVGRSVDVTRVSALPGTSSTMSAADEENHSVSGNFSAAFARASERASTAFAPGCTGLVC